MFYSTIKAKVNKVCMRGSTKIQQCKFCLPSLFLEPWNNNRTLRGKADAFHFVETAGLNVIQDQWSRLQKILFKLNTVLKYYFTKSYCKVRPSIWSSITSLLLVRIRKEEGVPLSSCTFRSTSPSIHRILLLVQVYESHPQQTLPWTPLALLVRFIIVPVSSYMFQFSSCHSNSTLKLVISCRQIFITSRMFFQYHLLIIW